MHIKKSLTWGTGVAGLFALAGAANASYVTYDFTGGSITVTALLNGTTVLSAGVISLTGGDVVFDPTASTFQLLSFQFNGGTATPMALTGALAGDSLSVSGLMIQQGAGYSVSGFGGTNPYTLTANSIAGSGSYNLTGSIAPAPHAGTFSEAGGDNTSIATTITLGPADSWQVLGLQGVELGSFTMGSGANARTVILKGDITFDAAPVPLPAGVLLLASGLGLLPLMRRRRPA